MERRKAVFSVETRLTPDKKRIIGRIPYNSLSEDLGGFRERILPGAVTDSVKGGRVSALWSHDTAKPLGNQQNGTLRLTEDSTGLNVEIWPGNQSWGQDALESVRRGDIAAFSFGFNVPDKNGERWITEGKENIRELISINLLEVSPVLWPAYPETAASVRKNQYEGATIMNLHEMKDSRGSIWEQMKRFNDKGSFNAEERAQYDRMESDFDKLTDQIKATEQAQEAERRRLERFHSQESRLSGETDSRSARSMPHDERIETRVSQKRGEVRVWQPGTFRSLPADASPEEDAAFTYFLQKGYIALSSVQKRTLEARGLQVDKDTSGGFLVAPEQFITDVIAGLMNQVFCRPYATVITLTNAGSLGAPALDNDPSDPQWTSELSIGAEDSTMNFDKRVLHPHPISKYLKASRTLIQRNPGVAAFVRDRLTYKFAVVEENAFLNGSGANQPLGVFVNSAHGINTDRDVSAGNLATSITGDGLINCKYSLKAPYRRSCRWLLHREAIKMIRKLKDADGNYLWKLGLSSDRPDTILDIPFDESEYAPSTFTSGSYVGILCNWGYYWIADALDMEIQVLTELFAATNQVGYVARRETDGMPVLSEAFARVKLGA